MMNGKSTYLLLDECHRWSKAQSDSILPAIERDHQIYRQHDGKPSGSHDAGYLSRCRLFLSFSHSRLRTWRKPFTRPLADEEQGFGRMQVGR